MAQVGSINLNAQTVMRGIMINFHFGRATRIRLWLGTRLIMLAALVIGCGVNIETDART